MTKVELTISSLEAEGLLKLDKLAVPDPYVCLGLKSAGPGGAQRTQSISNSSSPKWNETFVFRADDYERDSIVVSMFNANALVPDTPMMDQIEIPLTAVRLGEPLAWESGIAIRGLPAGRLRMVLSAAPRAAKKQCSSSCSCSDCQFSFGSLSSSYSTDFTGYTEYSRSLSPLNSSDERCHHQHTEPKEQTYHPKPAQETLCVRVCSCEGLVRASPDGTDAYVRVSLHGKRKEKGAAPLVTEVARGTESPVFNQEVRFESVKKGEKVVIDVFHQSPAGDFPIAALEVPVKDIDAECKEPKKFRLERPEAAANAAIANFVDFGQITLAFDHQITFNDNE